MFECRVDKQDIIEWKHRLGGLYRIENFTSPTRVIVRCVRRDFERRTTTGCTYAVIIRNIKTVIRKRHTPWSRTPKLITKVKNPENTSGVIKVSERFHEKMLKELEAFVENTWGGNWHRPWNYIMGSTEDDIIDMSTKVKSSGDGCEDRQRMNFTDLTNGMLHIALQGYNPRGVVKLGNMPLNRTDSTPYELAMRSRGREILVIGYSRHSDIQIQSCIINKNLPDGDPGGYKFRYYLYAVVPNPRRAEAKEMSK